MKGKVPYIRPQALSEAGLSDVGMYFSQRREHWQSHTAWLGPLTTTAQGCRLQGGSITKATAKKADSWLGSHANAKENSKLFMQ